MWPSGEEMILESVASPFNTRDDVASYYAAAIVYDAPVDWSKVNAAILERWTPSGLTFIKRRAWKRVKAHPHYGPTSEGEESDA